MVRSKAYKFRIYPNSTQKELLAKTFGCVRWLWNANVAVFNSYNKETNPNPEHKTSTQYRQEYEWMKEVSAAALQQKEKDFVEYKRQRFSKSRKKGIGNPSFKKKSSAQSYRLPNQKISLADNRIRLEKVGWVKMVVDRPIPDNAKIMSATISQVPSGKYFVSIAVEEKIEYKSKTNNYVGIDVGISKFATQSNGVEMPNPKWFRESQSELRKAQKHLSRKKIGSNRRNKQRRKVALIHEKIANQRKHYLQTYSTKLVEEFDIIAVEDLNVSGMLKNRRLAKSISDAGWSEFNRMLEYKCEWYGKHLVKIDRFYPSSKTCYHCGVIKDDLKLSDRQWVCECGKTIDRDFNAAKNIQRVGVNTLFNSRGDVVRPLVANVSEAMKVN